MPVSGEDKVCAQQAVAGRKEVIAVGQQQPEGIAVGRVDFGSQFLRRFLICITVGVIDAGKNQRIPVSLQWQMLIAQDCPTGGGERFLQRGDAACCPFVVAGDVIDRCDGLQSCCKFRSIGDGVRGFLVNEVTDNKNIFRLRSCRGGKQFLVILAEFGAVQVTKYHNAAAVKPCRQAGEHGVKPRGLQRTVAPPQEQGRQHCQKQQPQRPERPAFCASFCHRFAAS